MIHKIYTILFTSLIFQASVFSQVCVGTPGEVQWHAWNNLYDDEFSELTALPDYPNRPHATKTLFKLKAPENYNNYFGSRLRGFIKVDTTSSVTFNVTGNRRMLFYLSSDDNPYNKSLVASVPESVSQLAHDDYPEQTTSTILLTAGQFYYFEIIHVEGGGGDHFNVFWKTDLVDPLNWNTVTAAYISDVGCLDPACPDAGLPCDDGDATTMNDIEDGHCNCFGEKTTTNTCIGERGKLVGYQYNNIPGGDLNDLYAATNYPGMPSTSEAYDFFGRASTNVLVDAGFSVQAYLTVPVTGLYKFNVTGDDETILLISSDEDPANKQAHQMFVSGWTYMTEHDKYIFQTTAFLNLEKGKYYYVEINEKDGGGSEHFSAFWQTPFTEADTWKRIPSIYLHDNNCEIACIPQGTLCDDGDPFTNNDMYDNNCDCVGTPCSGPDCDSPLASYIPYEKCSPTEQLDDKASNNWLSCTESTNPNTLRSAGHWIMYDLGERHELHQTQVWNYNVMGNTQNGMQAVSVDWSDDGNTWQEYGIYNWPLATGDSGYSGFNGPHFNGQYARYILITSLDGPAACKGIGKIAFTAVLCPLSGTHCDDNDALTFNDKYNGNCECLGSAFDENECAEDNIVLGDSTIYTSKHSAITQVTSVSQVATNSQVSFIGGSSVILDVGFETDGQTLFLAAIDTCTVPEGASGGGSRGEALQAEADIREEEKMNELTVTDLGNGEVLVSYYIDKPGKASLKIKDMFGKKLYTILDHDFENKGLYHKRFRTKKFANGNYDIDLKTSKKSKKKKMVVAK